jgi:solute:Na+ symporter, SSS family
MLTSIDYTVVVFYGILVAILGYIAKRMVKNPNDYFAGGKKVPWWLAAISHHMSGYSAFVFVGTGSLAYASGLSAWTFFCPPIVFAMLIGAFVWAPRWSKMKIQTPIEYLEQRFNNKVRQIFGWSGIGVKFIDEGAKLYSLAIIVHVVTGWPLPEVIIACGIVTVAYLIFGGLWATVLTDFVQFIIQFAITLVIVPIVLKTVGGIGGLVEQMPAESRTLFSERVSPIFLFVYFLVILLSYNGGTWGLAQRFYSIGKPKDAKKAALLSAGLYLVYPLAVFIPIWAAKSIVGEVSNAEHAYILVAQKVLSSVSPGLIGLLIASMFAATMSMIDTDLNAMAAVFTKDIYQRTFKRDASDARLLRVGMMATLVLGALTIAAALLTIQMKGAFNAMIEWFAAILGPVSIPLLFGMLYRKTTWRGALASWFLGFSTFIFFKFGWPALTGQQTSFALYTGLELLVSFGVFMLEGVFAKPTKQEKEKVEEFFEQFESMT